MSFAGESESMISSHSQVQHVAPSIPIVLVDDPHHHHHQQHHQQQQDKDDHSQGSLTAQNAKRARLEEQQQHIIIGQHHATVSGLMPALGVLQGQLDVNVSLS